MDRMMTRGRFTTSVLVAVAVVAGMLPTTVALPTAEAVTETHAYLVNASTPAATAAAQAAVLRAGGKVVQSWPQIGVVVARSTRADFLTRLRRTAGRFVTSAGDARGDAVTDSAVTGHSVTVASTTRRIPTVGAAAVRGTSPDPMTSMQSFLAKDRATQANAITNGRSQVVVGVLDNGVDDRHPDIAPNFSRADSVDCTQGGRPVTTAGAWRGTEGHATHVAGTIAAARNGVGVTGVAPGVHVSSVKVVNSDDETYPDYLVCGYMWAAQRQLSVTNASINVQGLWCDVLGLSPAAITSVTRAINYSVLRGVANVASTGNDGENTAAQLRKSCHDPIAANPAVVHVGSVNATGKVSTFSNRGLGVVQVAAPGENIVSDGAGKGYERRSGTSQAAPQVAGTLALMRSLRPTAKTSSLVTTMLTHTSAPKVASLGKGCTGLVRANSCTGAGQLDTYAALKALR